MDLRFEWDRRKATANEAKHGVSFEEALTVFSDPLARIFDDPEHSSTESPGDHHRALEQGTAARRVLHRTRRRDSNFQCPEGHETGAAGL